MRDERPESMDHVKAFEFFYVLGDDRSLQAVADEFGVTLSAVQHWSHYWGWADRVKDRNAEVARELARDTLKEMVENRKVYSSFIQTLIQKGIDEYRQGNLLPTTVTDVLNLIKADLMLAENMTSLAQEPVSEGPTYIREFTMREIMKGATGNGYDERLARHISNEIVRYARIAESGDGVPDQPDSVAGSEAGTDE